MDRRITSNDSKAALKQIAGLIQKLSYRDMLAFGAVLGPCVARQNDHLPGSMGEALLDTADEILKPAPQARMPMPTPGDHRR